MSDDTRTPEEKAAAERRMTDPGVYIVGDKVIYDGEAETLGIVPMEKRPRPVPRKALRKTKASP